jgi:hypothetical protein
MAAKTKSRRSRSNWPTTGRLEEDVDAILLSRGIELNASVDKVLERSQRRRNVVVDNAQKKKLG